MEKISKNENLHNEQCNMCLEFNNKYVIFSCVNIKYVLNVFIKFY